MGVYVTNSGSNEIRNNYIHHSPYIGIALVGGREGLFWPERFKNLSYDGGEYVEWEDIPDHLESAEKWPYLLGFIHSRNNLVEHNDLHHIVGLLDDGNGIYLSGAGVGNVVRRNYVHDSDVGVSSGIRTDDSQFYARVTENVIRNIRGGGLTMKHINEFDNNVVIDCSYSFCTIFGRKALKADNYGASLRRNVFVQTIASQGKTPLAPLAPPFYYGPWWTDPKETFMQAIIENNVFWSPDQPEVAANALETIHRELGKDRESIAADPQFYDLETGDLRFDENSPLYRLGIQPIENYGLVEPVGPGR
jgi:parallel beta-helix repeat protein